LPDIHSELGASSCERWWNCPGSVRLSRGVERHDTAHSIEGTAAHKLAELCLTNGQEAVEYVGRVILTVDITPAIADRVQVFLDDVRIMIPDIALARDLQIEVRFNLSPLDPPAPMFGTADVVIYVPVWRKLYVRDYKNGWLFVDVTDNKQLRYYALGAMLALGADSPVSEIEVTIVQPRCTTDPIRRETFDAVELAEWSVDLMAHAHATLDPDPPTRAGKWCKFCPVEGSCRTRAEAQMLAAHADAQADFALPNPELLTPEESAVLLHREAAIRAFLDAHHEHCKRNPPPGWKLTESQGRDAWRDQSDAEVTLQAIHEIEPWAPRELISPAVARETLVTQIRERLGVKVRGSKKQAEAAARLALVDLIHKPRTGVKLVPESSPLPALPTHGGEFLLSAPSEPET
jgi:hypothetical protein